MRWLALALVPVAWMVLHFGGVSTLGIQYSMVAAIFVVGLLVLVIGVAMGSWAASLCGLVFIGMVAVAAYEGQRYCVSGGTEHVARAAVAEAEVAWRQGPLIYRSVSVERYTCNLSGGGDPVRLYTRSALPYETGGPARVDVVIIGGWAYREWTVARGDYDGWRR